MTTDNRTNEKIVHDLLWGRKLIEPGMGVILANDAHAIANDVAAALVAAQGAAPQITGSTSDGYHTFDELYEYRMLYNAHAAHGWLAAGIPVVKSWRHSDGEECFGGGWFIVTATLPSGQVSNHYKAEHWELFSVPEVELPPEYDGHTPQVAAERLRAAQGAAPQAESPAQAFADWHERWWRNEPDTIQKANAQAAFFAGWDARGAVSVLPSSTVDEDALAEAWDRGANDALLSEGYINTEMAAVRQRNPYRADRTRGGESRGHG